MELASKYNPADVEGKWYQYHRHSAPERHRCVAHGTHA